MAAAPKKAVAMCCVTLGCDHYLLPLDKGTKLIELMQSAVSCNRTYSRDDTYVVHEAPISISLDMVRPGQLRKAAPEPPALQLTER